MKKKPKQFKIDLDHQIAAPKINGGTHHLQLVESGAGLDVAILTKRTLDQLDEIGVHLDESGVIQFGNKCAAVNARALLKCIAHLSEGIRSTADAERIGPVLATVSKAMAMVTSNMSETALEKGGQGPVASKAKPYPIGKAVQMTQINVNVPAQAPEKVV